MAKKDSKDNKIDIVIDGKKVKVNKDTNIKFEKLCSVICSESGNKCEKGRFLWFLGDNSRKK